ncbi:hypothetical protein JL721_12689 [Aureococcus anophagefferens]|nr:hypothetical protein JL721_12689 [Aureococcus anophagefferens]
MSLFEQENGADQVPRRSTRRPRSSQRKRPRDGGEENDGNGEEDDGRGRRAGPRRARPAENAGPRVAAQQREHQAAQQRERRRDPDVAWSNAVAVLEHRATAGPYFGGGPKCRGCGDPAHKSQTCPYGGYAQTVEERRLVWKAQTQGAARASRALTGTGGGRDGAIAHRGRRGRSRVPDLPPTPGAARSSTPTAASASAATAATATTAPTASARSRTRGSSRAAPSAATAPRARAATAQASRQTPALLSTVRLPYGFGVPISEGDYGRRAKKLEVRRSSAIHCLAAEMSEASEVLKAMELAVMKERVQQTPIEDYSTPFLHPLLDDVDKICRGCGADLPLRFFVPEQPGEQAEFDRASATYLAAKLPGGDLPLDDARAFLLDVAFDDCLCCRDLDFLRKLNPSTTYRYRRAVLEVMRRRRMGSNCKGDGCKGDGGDGLSLTDARNWAVMQLHHGNARGAKARDADGRTISPTSVAAFESLEALVNEVETCEALVCAVCHRLETQEEYEAEVLARLEEGAHSTDGQAVERRANYYAKKEFNNSFKRSVGACASCGLVVRPGIECAFDWAHHVGAEITKYIDSFFASGIINGWSAFDDARKAVRQPKPCVVAPEDDVGISADEIGLVAGGLGRLRVAVLDSDEEAEPFVVGPVQDDDTVIDLRLPADQDQRLLTRGVVTEVGSNRTKTRFRADFDLKLSRTYLDHQVTDEGLRGVAFDAYLRIRSSFEAYEPPRGHVSSAICMSARRRCRPSSSRARLTSAAPRGVALPGAAPGIPNGDPAPGWHKEIIPRKHDPRGADVHFYDARSGRQFRSLASLRAFVAPGDVDLGVFDFRHAAGRARCPPVPARSEINGALREIWGGLSKREQAAARAAAPGRDVPPHPTATVRAAEAAVDRTGGTAEQRAFASLMAAVYSHNKTY